MYKTKNLFIISTALLLLISCGKTSETENILNSQESIKTEEIIINDNIESTIIALGDSLTAGYNLDISDSFPNQLADILSQNGYNYKIINAGVSGDTSKNLLDRIQLYDNIDAEMYILSIGGNDGLRQQSVENLQKNIETIIDHIQGINTDAKVVLTGIQMPLNVGIEYSNSFNALYPYIYGKNKEIYFYPFLLEGVATNPELNLSDGIHPNKEGYMIIANNIYDYLREEKLITK